ncbi:MAG TPA: hybrid sensor histidine kinase/response regulator [Gemmatimonadaceae bacterium]|nr:hybrid sensor histidine kinase/response regulator [Gemmatimonadaceae bacterium]
MTTPASVERAHAPLILVADDAEANVALLTDQLEVMGYRVAVAADGPSALAAAVDRRPDLVILDVSMPPGDLGVAERDTGFEVCRRLKRDPRTARIPVVFVTALSDTSDRVKAIEAGGDDFLNKPYHRLVLSARIQALLKLKGATDALEQSLKRLAELQKVRDDLLKMIVHDLKAPLTSILATLEMMRDGDFGDLTTPQARALSDAEGKAEDLLGLIEDLLEVARIEERTLPLDPEQIAPAALLQEIVYDWRLRFEQEGVSASVDVADDAPVFVADKALFKRVLGNLVQNAVNHSPGPVTLRLAARRDPKGILFTVADNGPGIPADYQEIIFRKFEQVHAQHAPRVRSSGLGLTFCRLAVESHGGRIWVTSTEGEGSTFFVQMPLEPREPVVVSTRTGEFTVPKR